MAAADKVGDNDEGWRRTSGCRAAAPRAGSGLPSSGSRAPLSLAPPSRSFAAAAKLPTTTELPRHGQAPSPPLTRATRSLRRWMTGECDGRWRAQASGPLAAEEAEEVAAALVDEDSAKDLISLHRFLVPSTCCVMDGAHRACSSSASMSSPEPESVVRALSNLMDHIHCEDENIN
uniref:Uncharacterized protein n=1 Tax=Oryza rufipogon TaxID=4529 RepID=A0A0E0R724_ORYRU